MTSLFFMWGFLATFNDILTARFREAFTLDYYHAMFVPLTFFGAYFIGSAIYFAISATTGDPIARIGYKNGVILGLLISAAGTGLFWPAANATSYPMFLAALFVIGLGSAMLQIAANPYVTILGPESTASSRLNLAQGFNSIGTTIGPLVGGYLVFQYFARSGAHGAESVKVPYLAFCVLFLVLAAIFFCIRLPHVGEGRVEPGAGALKYPHVLLGVLAIFMYVGGRTGHWQRDDQFSRAKKRGRIVAGGREQIRGHVLGRVADNIKSNGLQSDRAGGSKSEKIASALRKTSAGPTKPLIARRALNTAASALKAAEAPLESES